MLRSRFVSSLLLSALVLGAPGLAQAQTYPDRPIKLVVPFAAGGATDILGRLLATALGERLGQPMVVENRPGAGTVVAASMVAKAPADGYTLLLGSNTTLTMNPAIRTNLPYDPLKSFTPLALVADMGLLLVAHNDTPGQSLKDIVAQAKAAPDKFSYGSYGTGSSVHFGAEMLKTTAGFPMMHVPFNGSSPSLTALMGGQVQLAVDTVVASTPLIKSGKIKAIAALSPQRLALLPNVPTVAESGYPGFEADQWYGIVAPAGLPAPLVQLYNSEINKALASPEVARALSNEGAVPTPTTPQAFAQLIASEIPRWARVILRGNVKPD